MGSSWEQDWCAYHVFRQPENLFRCGGWPDFGRLVDVSTSPHVCRASTPGPCKYDPVTAA